MRYDIKMIFCLSLAVTSLPLLAAGIKKCINSNGEIIFTDLACPNDSQSQEVKGITSTPLQGSSSRPRAVSSVSSPSSSQYTKKIQGLIDSARSECEAGLYDYLISKHPNMHDEEIKHEGVAEKHIEAENAMIKIVSSAKYMDDIHTINQKVNCEATKTSAGGWKLEYVDQPYNVGIQFKPIGELKESTQ